MKVFDFSPLGNRPIFDMDIGMGTSFKCYEKMGISKTQTFCCVIEDDGLTGADIHDGEAVIVDAAREVENGQLALVSVNNEFMVRCVYFTTSCGTESWRSEQVKVLHSKNYLYPSFYPTASDDVVIIGPVCGIMRKV